MSVDDKNLLDLQRGRNDESEENKLPHVSLFRVKSKTCTPPIRKHSMEQGDQLT